MMSRVGAGDTGTDGRWGPVTNYSVCFGFSINLYSQPHNTQLLAVKTRAVVVIRMGINSSIPYLELQPSDIRTLSITTPEENQNK